MFFTNKFHKQAERDYAAYITRKHLWFDRAVALSGQDNLFRVITRLNDFFPKESVPDKQWFIELFRRYIEDPEAFIKEEEENLCQYCDIWENNEPRIDEINTFQNQHNTGKGIVIYSRAFNVWVHEFIKERENHEFAKWYGEFKDKVGFTAAESQAELIRSSTLNEEEHRISMEKDQAKAGTLVADTDLPRN